jgi:hypothetical protein
MQNGSLAIMTSLFQVRIDPDRFRKRRWLIVGLVLPELRFKITITMLADNA